METFGFAPSFQLGQKHPHSLGILIEWKLDFIKEPGEEFLSPLVGDIN